MQIEYGHEGQLCEVADASVDASKIVTFRFREPPKLVRKEVKEQPWVEARVEFLDDETAKVEYPNATGIRGPSSLTTSDQVNHSSLTLETPTYFIAEFNARPSPLMGEKWQEGELRKYVDLAMGALLRSPDSRSARNS